MRIVVASDKWKGSLSASDACAAMVQGLRMVWPAAELIERPIADGGEGTAAVVHRACGGEWFALTVRGPLGDSVEASYVLLPDGTAVIEMAAAAGLALLKPAQLDPWRATTYGVGQLMRDAADRGAKTIIVGLGGSATNDGGAGMASALGWEFGWTQTAKGAQCFQPDLSMLVRRPGESRTAWKDCPPFSTSRARKRGQRQPNLALLLQTAAPPFPWVIDQPGAIPGLKPPPSGSAGLNFGRKKHRVDVLAACDVTNPLLGPRGATRVFGPQKGIRPEEIELFENSMGTLASFFPPALAETPGAGAAGGLGFGLLAFCGARIVSGFGIVADLMKLEDSIAAADLVVTGEGSLDAQTLDGKGPHGVAQLARKHGKPVVGIGGRVLDEARTAFDLTVAVASPEMPLAEAMRRASELIEAAICQAAPDLLTLVG